MEKAETSKIRNNEIAVRRGLPQDAAATLVHSGASLKIRVIAPGAAPSQPDIETAASIVRNEGHTVIFGKNLFKRHRYLAGELGDRLGDLAAAFTDDDIDAVWCARGGTGAIELLPHLKAIHFTRPFVGYSDNISLLSYVAARGGQAIHGPVFEEIARPYRKAQLDSSSGMRPDALRVIQLLLGTSRTPDDMRIEVCASGEWQVGAIEGTTLGGNLTTLASMMGTPWQPSFAEALLLLEDVGEPYYRLERNFLQLIQAGALQDVKAVVLGDFHACPRRDVSQSIEQIFREHLRPLNVPIVSCSAFGHGDNNFPWRFGSTAVLNHHSLAWSA